MKKIIITADDYGMSQAVNEAIDAGIAAGIITSTNVMTNMPCYKEALKLKENPNVSLGIHWVLACGKPVLPPEEVPTLVNTDGEFYPFPVFRQRLRKKLISFADVKKELLAQYNLYYDLLGQPDYWNTHQNTHVDMGIYRFFVDTAAELGITNMRSHQRLYVLGSDQFGKRSLKWRILEPIKSKMLNVWQNNAHKKGIHSPDGIIVRLKELSPESIKYTFNNIDWKDKNIAEFVIHPATRQDSPYFGGLVEKRLQEYEIFSAQQTKEMILAAGVELVTFEG